MTEEQHKRLKELAAEYTKYDIQHDEGVKGALEKRNRAKQKMDELVRQV